MIGVDEITNMDIEEVKLNFFTLMNEIVKANGDDQEGTGAESDWQTQLPIISPGKLIGDTRIYA